MILRSNVRAAQHALSRTSLTTPHGSSGLNRTKTPTGNLIKRWSIAGLFGGSFVSSAFGNDKPPDKRGAEEDRDPTTVESKGAAAANSNENSKLSWDGLSILRFPFSVPDITSLTSSWTWPASFSSIQSQVSDLLLELARGPTSLYSQVVNDAPDPDVYPECQWDAEVRLGDQLCLSERAFLKERKRKMKATFAKLFEVPESEIEEEDLPIVAIAGSGGGFRAMMNTIGSLIGARRTGLFDCVTYVAGISGSCWALGALYSGVAGDYTPESTAAHLIDRIQTSYLDRSALDMLTTFPTNKYLLYGLLRKATSPSGSVSLTDVYGTLVSARLFVPSDLSHLDPRHLSLHMFRRTVDSGDMPMPIFTAIYHDIPPVPKNTLETLEQEKKVTLREDKEKLERKEAQLQSEAQYLWFEFTPFETGCDGLGVWIPSWAFGRQFDKGKSLDRNPGINFSILTGIFASAFCASLQHYFNEIQPILRQLPTQLYGWLDEIVSDNDAEMGVVHPILPTEVPNFVKGLAGQLKEGSPVGITEKDTIGLMDAGAELNIPYYPLFRRDVDCIIALDASADSQDLWFTRAEEYAVKRGLSKWPMGARWPTIVDRDSKMEDGVTTGSQAFANRNEAQVKAQSMVAGHTTKPEDINRTLAEKQEGEAGAQLSKQEGVKGREMHGDRNENGDSKSGEKPDSTHLYETLSPSTIWIGTSSSSSSTASSRMDELEEQDLLARDGIAIVYNPLIPNDQAVDAEAGFNPMEVSTWSVAMGRTESLGLKSVAEANFIEGSPKIIKLLKIIWLRKKREREEKQVEMRRLRRRVGKYMERLGPGSDS